MRTGILLLLIHFTAVDVIAQVNLSQPIPLSEKGIKCFTYESMEQFRKTHPGAETDAQFESWMKKKTAERKARRDPQPLATVTLPVVFHIIHNAEAEGTGNNMSTAAIHQQLLQLNKDFANKSNSLYAISADIEIQFALAAQDPAGNPMAQPGIDRVNRVTAGFTAPPYNVGYQGAPDYLNSTIKPATIWDPTRYVNVWILPMQAGILGIATFPVGSTLPGLTSGVDMATTAGVAIAPLTVGSIFTPNGCGSYGKGKTLTHELGHFFGLRHIWGDGTCATDYCDDTPTHQTSNSGVPVHPKPNNCTPPTADEMFENYMDYCNDITLNTFTENQKDRVETVMLNSPRRSTLATSTVPTVPLTATNRIAFDNCAGAMTVSETSPIVTYPRYKDVRLMVNVEDKATANATVTINTGGTAVNNYHYQVLTPSLNFVAGDDYKPVTVRIFDNTQTESSRTIILSYSISGAGVIAGSSVQTFTITVTDDDAVNVNNNPVTIISQDFPTAGLPSGWNILTGGGLNQWKFGNVGSAGGTGNCAYISNGTVSPFPFTYDNTSTSISVLRTPVISGYSDVSVSFKYRVWGENDGTAWDFGSLKYSRPTAPNSYTDLVAANAGPYAGTTAVVNGTPTVTLPKPTFDNTAFYIWFWWENDDNTGNNPPLAVDDIVVTGYGTRIETAVANSYTYDVLNGTTNHHYRSTNGKIIASINNASENITALTASVASAGNGTTAINTGMGSYLRTQKVIHLTTASPSTTVTYSGTLYFTDAELAAWGTDKLNLKILKVNDGVALNTTLNSSNAEVIMPTNVTENTANGYIAYTGNFTGFSQFMLVSPTFALPVSMLTFEANGQGSAIALKWSTAQESQNKGFGIERSLNGTDFSRIGFVEGKGNSNVRSDYSYIDQFVQPNTLYYYRLAQTDVDGKETLSGIRQASIDQTGLKVIISPNPAKTYVNVFIAGTQQRVDIDVINAQGQVVQRRKNMNVSSAPLPLQVASLARGMYTIAIQLEKERIVKQVVLQ